MRWRLAETSATGFAGASQIEVLPSTPTRAASWQLDNSSAQPWQFASVSSRPSHSSVPEEAYSRQGDLIVRYRQGSNDKFAYQLDWMLLPAPSPFVAAVELWLSVQTNLLDTEPELEAACSAMKGQSWRVFEHKQLDGSDLPSPKDAAAERGPAALLCCSTTDQDNASGAALSGLWLIEPSDQCNSYRSTSDEQDTQRIRLFGHFMEKGVIRRARMRFLLAHGAVSIEQVIVAYRELANSPLPLTA